MVEDNVIDVFYIQLRHTAVGQVAGAEANMAHDTVAGQFHLIASQADSTAWSRLSGNGQIGL